MLLLLFAFMALTAVESAPNFYSGVLSFEQTRLSQTTEVGKLTRPQSILSIISLEYSDSFRLLVSRRLYNQRKQYFLEVNVTVSSDDKPLRWSMDVHYLLVRQLANIEVYSLNITSRRPTATISPKNLDVRRSRCILFPLGFSNSSMAERVIGYAHSENQEFIVYRKGTLQNPTVDYYDWWLFV